MEYTFSDRTNNLKPSAIREIFKYAADPTVVSLSAGNPSPDAFPVKELEEISARLFRENPIGLLQYSVTEGYAPLREYLTKYMKEKCDRAEVKMMEANARNDSLEKETAEKQREIARLTAMLDAIPDKYKKKYIPQYMKE